MDHRIAASGIIKDLGRVAVAYSGGVDSTLLLKLARDVLGSENVLALTAHAQHHSEREVAFAKDLAEKIGVGHAIVPMDLYAIEGMEYNPRDRCYICKRAVFSKLWDEARARGFQVLCDGSNVDDEGDFRPGMRAVAELMVRSPLREAGFRKADIRALSAELGLPTATMPALACLATRIPYDTKITDESLRRIDRAETALFALGLSQARVRDHAGVARIEVPPEDIAALAARHEEIAKIIRDSGFAFVALDLEGYRMGRMNE